MKVIRLFVLILFCASCGKDKESLDAELYEKAEKKLAEMESLIETADCGNLSDWQIDTVSRGPRIGYVYLPVGNAIKKKYYDLKSEYSSLLEQAMKLDQRPVLAMPIRFEPHFGIGCVSGHPKVLLSSDFNLERTKSLLRENIVSLETFYSNPRCSEVKRWIGLPIIKDCKLKYVLFLDDDSADSKAFRKLYEQHESLLKRRLQLDSNDFKCGDLIVGQKETDCENNTPIIRDASS
ncbi:hypothetical protein [Sphingobacterium sp. DR205]|uniref:hypothetical protein n=1 Tax=Sphingobacterium sp. DR205 TaxID=2713573 RepID=UPI0013E525AA|nr:hypothetical protein [Sphingobacterium sp. DR205]QIH35704.1 hypothetical protein G6053_23770 [Sphingobacterium sp. DR205]